MELLNNIRWFLIRLLLMKEERRHIWEASEKYFDEQYEQYLNDQDYKFPSKKANMIAKIRRGINW